MSEDCTTSRLPWETPATVSLTDTESRADQRDVALRNGDEGPPAVASLP
jgi:hypothetical protein